MTNLTACCFTLDHRPLLHGLLSPCTATLELTADIVCIHCFRFRYVTNGNHCIVPKALIVPRSKSMHSRPDNGKNVRRKRHSVPQDIAWTTMSAVHVVYVYALDRTQGLDWFVHEAVRLWWCVCGCRGKRSLETICLVLAYKIKYPNNFFVLRGNHECASINRWGAVCSTTPGLLPWSLVYRLQSAATVHSSAM